MKVNIWIKNDGRTYDLIQTEKGNPGIGGTQYELSLISHLLTQMYDHIQVVVYTNNKGIVSETVSIRYVECISEMLSELNGNAELLIFAQTDVDDNFYRELAKTDIVAIAWVHNYLTYPEYRNICNTESIKKVVFVGQQLYDHYVDSDIIKKSTVIYNCIPQFKVGSRRFSKDRPVVVFAGALIPQKGFHVLAKAWKYIVNECENAELYVMGGRLYGNDAVVERYIKKCCKYLEDKQGNLLEGVHFLGVVNENKDDFYTIASVGVANPTGKTETFCLSAVEFEAHGIPVVTFDGYGLIDTVLDKQTGFRINGSRQLAKKIVQLIQDMDLNYKMGEEGKKFTNDMFTPEIIIPKWYNLIISDFNNSVNEFSYSNYRNDYKWLRYINYSLKKLSGKRWFSVQEVTSYVKFRVKKMLYKG